MPETPFAETNALLAALLDDDDEVKIMLSDFNLSELCALIKGCDKLSALCDDELERRE
jgi:hypothetical protein